MGTREIGLSSVRSQVERMLREARDAVDLHVDGLAGSPGETLSMLEAKFGAVAEFLSGCRMTDGAAEVCAGLETVQRYFSPLVNEQKPPICVACKYYLEDYGDICTHESAEYDLVSGGALSCRDMRTHGRCGRRGDWFVAESDGMPG